MDEKRKRFNLSFNLKSEEERFAVQVLERLGRRKSMFITKAILFLLEHHPDALSAYKKLNLRNLEDLIVRGFSEDTSIVTNALKSDTKIETVKRLDKNSQNNEIKNTQKQDPKPNKHRSEVEPNITIESDDGDNALLELLDGLDAFYEE